MNVYQTENENMEETWNDGSILIWNISNKFLQYWEGTW
jgi:hypothetical protein